MQAPNLNLFQPPFTAEHDEFRDNLRKFLKKEVVPHVEIWEKQKDFPRELFRKFADLGYFGIRLPEKYGGLELDYWYTVCFIEELTASGSGGFNMDIMDHAELALPIIRDLGTDLFPHN